VLSSRYVVCAEPTVLRVSLNKSGSLLLWSGYVRGAVYGYLEVRGFEAGRIGGCVQMYSVQPLISPDCEIVVCINSPEGLACFLFCTVRPVARILPWSCIDGYCQVYVEQRRILGC
jgi:hypothetical protein